MTTLVIVLLIAAALAVWSALQTCTLETFVPQTQVRSQVAGATAFDDVVRALLGLPGVRELDSTDGQVLFSAVPVPSSLDRGYGMFVVARKHEDGVLLLARPRIPLPGPRVESGLRQLECQSRMRCVRRG
jgi:hypothetical protein